jgi:uncharacterized 2Fe-2S/4Fe-4S cluster protein (DUF4445 family)
MMPKRIHGIDFEPIGRRGQCTDGQSLLDCARKLGIELASICGGKGTCGKCKIQILSGTTSEPTSAEQDILPRHELERGYRLACQTSLRGDCKVGIPLESLTTPQRAQVEGLQVDVAPDPPVRSYNLELSPPSLSDYEADAERLIKALEQQHQVSCQRIDTLVLRELSPKLRACEWKVQASVRGDEIIAIGAVSSHNLGLAIDLGTTKVAGYLLDLDTGKVLSSKGIMNPQIARGEDVISRIARAQSSHDEAAHFQQLAATALNQLASDLCAEIKAEPRDIVEAVVVGNTAMHHLLLRLPVEQLALSPYVPAVKGALDIKARDIGLKIAPGGYVHLLPNIAGFVGADHVAMLLATDAWRAQGLLLALDIGTNTEVCLADNGKMCSVSCASGPAFEGAHIKHGMRGASGAIEHIRIAGDKVELQTIGGGSAVGICGSGILDAIAQLHIAGVLEANGRIQNNHKRVRIYQDEAEFVLVSENENEGKQAITLTQKDVRQLQLAKAAIRTGIQVLLEHNKRSEDEIEQVVIAGAFGSYMNIASAVTIGMLPPLPLNRFRQVGNAAGMGAKLALISKVKRAEADAIASQVDYVELATAPRFSQTFAQSNYLGKYRIANGKRGKID